MSTIPTVLDRIIATKREEIAPLKASVPDKVLLMERALAMPATRGFRRAIEAAGPPCALIAEIKKASPSKGVIRADFDPVVIAKSYEEGGATCLSVLTDVSYFQGSPDNLQLVRDVVSLPLIRKDFIIDPVQIYEARVLGADAVLLIVAATPSAARLAELRTVAESLGMDALVEVHDEEEVAIALASGATLIGVNNRNLHDFSVDLGTFAKLAGHFGDGVTAVAESGILTNDDLKTVVTAGADAILVGEALMRQDDIRAATKQLLAT
ncbi:MAG: indole-3-glycerol phosphate synthase TrpC [Armatimonadota bacterium]